MSSGLITSIMGAGTVQGVVVYMLLINILGNGSFRDIHNLVKVRLKTEKFKIHASVNSLNFCISKLKFI